MAIVYIAVSVFIIAPLLLGWVGAFISPLLVVLIPVGVFCSGIVQGLRKLRPASRSAQIIELRKPPTTVSRKRQRYG